MIKILLVLISVNVFAIANFSRSSLGVVSDSVTTLEWQDSYSDGIVKSTTWQSAIDYCEALELDGIGWRLPNKNELFSIVDYTKHNPSINNSSTGFQNTIPYYYWSSTTNAKYDGTAWIVYFD